MNLQTEATTLTTERLAKWLTGWSCEPPYSPYTTDSISRQPTNISHHSM